MQTENLNEKLQNPNPNSHWDWVSLRWNGTLYMDQKVCFNLKKRPIVRYCTHEQKMNFEGFTQNGCYGNQHTAFWVSVL